MLITFTPTSLAITLLLTFVGGWAMCWRHQRRKQGKPHG